MTDSLYGRGLYVFVGLSSDSRSPTSDDDASTWAKPPLPGQRAFETDAGAEAEYRFNGNKWRQISTTTAGGSDAGLVVLSPIQAIDGTSETWVLVGADASPTTTDDYITDATGYKGFSVEVPNTITTAQHLLIGWSTTASDQAAVASILDTLDGHLDSTPATAIANANCAIISINKPGPVVIFYDGTTKIKTISVRGHGAAYQSVVTTIS